MHPSPALWTLWTFHFITSVRSDISSIITNGTDYTFSQIFRFENWRVSIRLIGGRSAWFLKQVDTGTVNLIRHCFWYKRYSSRASPSNDPIITSSWCDGNADCNLPTVLSITHILSHTQPNFTVMSQFIFYLFFILVDCLQLGSWILTQLA